ncbi:MAG: hypothetical protein ACR2RF_01040 [Geminicoccaceae bacterium]
MDQDNDDDKKGGGADVPAVYSMADKKELILAAREQGYDLVPSGQVLPQPQERHGNAWSLSGEIASPDQAARIERRNLRYVAIGAVSVVALVLGGMWVVTGAIDSMFTASLEVTHRAMDVIEHQATIAGEVSKNTTEAEAAAKGADVSTDKDYVIAVLAGLAALALGAGIIAKIMQP